MAVHFLGLVWPTRHFQWRGRPFLTAAALRSTGDLRFEVARMREMRRFVTILLAIAIGFAAAGPFIGGASALSTDRATAFAASIVATTIGVALMVVVRRIRSPIAFEVVGVITGALTLLEALFGQLNNPVSVGAVATYEYIGMAVVAFAVPWRPIAHYIFLALAVPIALVGLTAVPGVAERNGLVGALFFAVVLSLIGKPIVWRMRVQLHRQSMQMRALNAQLVHLAHRDPTTGLASRLAFGDRLSNLARRPAGQVAFAMVDVDHFKSVNDTFGHQAGDETLARVADAVRGSIRESDEAFRYGGEEFVVVFERADRAALKLAGERIRATVEKEQLPNPRMPLGVVTVSVGMSLVELPADIAALRLAVAVADEQMYLVKRSGRNAVAIAP